MLEVLVVSFHTPTEVPPESFPHTLTPTTNTSPKTSPSTPKSSPKGPILTFLPSKSPNMTTEDDKREHTPQETHSNSERTSAGHLLPDKTDSTQDKLPIIKVIVLLARVHKFALGFVGH